MRKIRTHFLSLIMALTIVAFYRVHAVPLTPVVDQDYLPAVLQLINNATNSISFLQLEYHYDPTVKQIQEAMARAVKRGVKVYGLLEDNIDFNADSLPFLEKLGIKVKLDTKKKMLHSKLFVFDKKKTLLGSTNLTGNSMDNNHETNILIDNAEISQYFSTYIDLLLADSETEPDLPAIQTDSLKTIINRQYFDEILALLNGAEKRIKIVLYGVKYYTKYPDSKTNRLIDALITAHNSGVDVELVLDLSNYNDKLNEINQKTKEHLEQGGVSVFYDDIDTTTHAKMILVDDAIVIGSANWGYDAIERRNEACVLIADPQIVHFFNAYFERVKEEGQPTK